MKLSTFIFVLQGATSTSRTSRNFALHRVGSAQLTLEEVLKQIPSAGRVLRTIRNAKVQLENYRAQENKRPNDDPMVERQRSNLITESSSLAGDKEVPQVSGIGGHFDNFRFDTLWSGAAQFGFANLSEDLALDMFNWTPDQNDISWKE